MSLAERLSQKGWSKEEIAHAMHHMKVAESRKSPLRKTLEIGLFWFILLVLAAANLAFAYILFPFLSSLPVGLGYVSVIILGLVCGVLFGHVLHDIAELEPKHHALVLFLATLTAVGSSLYVANNSVLLASTFCAVFILYYSYLWWRYGR